MSAEEQSVTKVWQPWNEPDKKPFVRIEKITKKFGNFTAVDNISLDIYEKEFFSLLGPSGCGKTTLLRMLAGLEVPTGGRILIDDEDMSAVPPHKRPVNMMFQSYALFPHMSVEQNIAFGLKQGKIAKAEIIDRCQDMLNLVQMQDFAKRKPNQLSGGQRQRVALARALVKNPKILLLDEPLGALDKKLREETQFELVNIQEKLGITFVIVTHDQEEAMTMSSRTAVMDTGRVIQLAPPSEVYEHPNSRKVAEFIGDVNIIVSKVETVTQNSTVLKNQDIPAVITTTHNVNTSSGDTVWIAIRPEKMVISLSNPDHTETNILQGKVWDIAYLGKISVFHVKLANGDIIKVIQTNRARETERTITWEDDVYISWAPDAAVILLK